MLILTKDPSLVLLQVSPQNLDGTPKTSLAVALVRVYSVVDDEEVEALESTSLVQVSASKVWRYSWEPESLDPGCYVAEYTLTDDDSVTAVVTEDIVITKDLPTAEEIDAVLTAAHGEGHWATVVTRPPRIIPGNGA